LAGPAFLEQFPQVRKNFYSFFYYPDITARKKIWKSITAALVLCEPAIFGGATAEAFQVTLLFV
jgi:hypothetical protein